MPDIPHYGAYPRAWLKLIHDLWGGYPGFEAHEIDVVAIHGFGGSPYRSWASGSTKEHGESAWLQDVLPQRIHGARVMMFGQEYFERGDSVILSAEGVTHAAQTLLQSLVKMRPHSEGIPLAFVACDFGGLIVKKALIMAESDSMFSDISQSCSHLTFFASPHRCPSTSSLEDVLMNIYLASPPESRPFVPDVVTRMKALSAFVGDLSVEFVSTPRRRSIINVFQETGGVGRTRIVVDRHSATTGLVHEINVARLEEHNDLCTLLDDDPVVYLIIDTLKAETNREYRSCLSLLYGDSPPVTLDQGYHGLYDVCLEGTTGLHEEFEAWLSSSEPCITTSSGPNGAGTGFCAPLLFRRLKERSIPTVYFSFSRGDSCRASFGDLLGSVAFQVLSWDPARYQGAKSLHALAEEAGAWTQPMLLSLFRSFLHSSNSPQPLHVVIDGLHKCDSSWKQLVEALLGALSDDHFDTKLKVALFYQDQADISDALRKLDKFRTLGPTLTGLLSDASREALASRIVRNAPRMSRLRTDIDEALERCNSITELLLTIDSLENSAGMPRNFNFVKSLTKMHPPVVAEVVANQYRRLSSWARCVLGWVSHAKRPLSLGEVAVAVALTSTCDRSAISLDPHDLPVDTEAEVKSAFGALLGVESGRVTFGTDDIRTCFLTLIAEEQQQHRLGEATRSEPEPSAPAVAMVAVPAVPDDAQIARVLLEYLSMPEFIAAGGRLEGPLFELATYAAQFLPVHYRAAKVLQPDRADLSRLVQNRSLVSVWSRLVAKVQSVAAPPELCVIDPFLLAAQVGLVGLIDELEPKIDDQTRSTAIMLASRNGHAAVTARLLEDSQAINPGELIKAMESASARDHESIVEQLLEHMKADDSLTSTQLDKMASQAARFGHENQVRLFLQYGPSSVNAAPEGVTPLQYAAESGHFAMARFLLREARADVNSEAGTEKDAPLLLAAANGHLATVEILLEENACVTARSRTDCTSLYLAAQRGHESICKALLDFTEKHNIGAEQPFVDAADSCGRTPLMAACRGMHTRTAQILLERGASPELTDLESHSVLDHAIHESEPGLSWLVIDKIGPMRALKYIDRVFLRAAECGLADLVEYLLSAGDVSLKGFRDEKNYTALHYAAKGGQQDVLRLLLEHGADAEAEGDDERTPLELAAVAGKLETLETLLDFGAIAVREVLDRETIIAEVAQAEDNLRSYGRVVELMVERGVDPDACIGRTPPLHQAAARNKFHVVQALLENRADPTIKGRWGWNALHYAADYPGVSGRIAELLINGNVDGTETEVDGWQPVHLAARRGNIEFLQVLYHHHQHCLEARTDDGRVPLHFANGSPRSLEWLLDHNIDINVEDEDNTTALMMTVSAGNEEAFDILMAAKADTHIQDTNGRTVLHHAARHGRVNMGRKILRRNADLLGYKDNDGLSALHSAIINGREEFAEILLDDFYPEAHADLWDDLDVNNRRSTNNRKNTPLLSAVKNDQMQVVERLLEMGAQTDVQDEEGKTVLLLAVSKGSKRMIEVLLNRDIPNRADVNAGGGAGQPTALHEAARKGKKVLVEQLVRLGAKVNSLGGQFNTALTAAAFTGYDDVVLYLLDREADASLNGGVFPNALGAALYSETYDLVDKLIDAGAKVNDRDAQGRTVLHLAARRGVWWLLEMFLQDHEGDPDVADEQGRTLLHHAAMSGDSEVVSRLLQRGSDQVDLPDVDGWTALHWACRSEDNLEIIEKLVEAGADVGRASRDRWTPENIAAFHGAEAVRSYIWEELEKRAQPPPRKNWKVGTERYIICDGCLFYDFFGAQWNCNECQDFDFCFKCYWTAEKTHPGHTFTPHGVIPGREPEVSDDG
ncbi:uncharacterized protein DNG_04880 [Cephalotrichum gorgonifer]|uniref:ZZ-type domain-containing protein n=1 Tax=Cephalotrichum gorgonifer TaxID=2041049 RepID=A0AAE8SVS3_9PEZI|nr:uncharacterized protein DNG_04880 [Cephalotrichum gorgonifer]